MRNLKLLAVVFFVVAIAPFIIMKLGFWDETFAKSGSPKYTEAYPPIVNQQVVSYATAVERAAPAVVSIHPTKIVSQEMNPIMRDPFFRQFFGDMGTNNMPQEIQPSLGSGVIISKEGYILTNNHVIAGADEIKIKLVDGRTTQAKLIGTDPETDVAILKVDLPNLPAIAMGDSDKLKTGDVVLAIGNPFGVGQTVTQGIVSATQRTSMGINTFENFIQTDAPINPGNSGGALIDAYGNLVGINNAIISRSGGYQGIGFAIPVSLAKDVMSQLIENGTVTRGWLGITVMPLTDEARKSLNYPKGDGTVIGAIVRGGPAAKSGLQPGDIIVSLDGEKTSDANGVLGIAARLVPEKAYPITVVRNNQTLDVRIVAGKRPGPVKAENQPKPTTKSQSRPID